MNVLSLFDGISAALVALNRVDIKVDNYYASEVDKYAIQTAMKSHPKITQLGNIKNNGNWDLPKIDLIVGGSPCQGFSFAGKQLNFNDPRSALFFEFVRCLQWFSPKYFLLENVKMKKEYQDIISFYLGVEPIEINSSLVSAQNRKRLYWTNIPGITQPTDKNIFLKDIIDHDLQNETVVRDKSKTSRVGARNSPVNSRQNWDAVGLIKNRGKLQLRNKKAMCLDANYHKGVDNHGQRTQVGMIHVADATNINGHDIIKRIYHSNGKSPTLTSNTGGNQEVKILCNEDIPADIYYRKLTPLECERLQTFPDNYTERGLSTSYQRCYIDSKHKKDSVCNLVGLKNVVNLSQVGKLNSAINTILGLSEMGRLMIESLSIKASRASRKDVACLVKCSMVTVSSITKRGNERNLLQRLENAQFALKISEVGGVGYVTATLSQKEGTETPIKSISMKIGDIPPTEIKGGNTIKKSMVDGLIGLLLRLFSEEHCEKGKLFIILIWINLIIVKAIFMSVNQTLITSLSIGSSNKLHQNLLQMELLDLKMESITEMSNTSRYKALGNSWTVDVVSHIFKGLKLQQLLGNI